MLYLFMTSLIGIQGTARNEAIVKIDE